MKILQVLISIISKTKKNHISQVNINRIKIITKLNAPTRICLVEDILDLPTTIKI